MAVITVSTLFGIGINEEPAPLILELLGPGEQVIAEGPVHPDILRGVGKMSYGGFVATVETLRVTFNGMTIYRYPLTPIVNLGPSDTLSLGFDPLHTPDLADIADRYENRFR